MIFVNARFLTQRPTGVQRFAFEISRALKKIRNDIVFISPGGIVNREMADELNPVIAGFSGSHLWEQVYLPFYLMREGNPLLLNLANTAPVFYRNKIVTIHDLAVFRYPRSFSWSFVRFYRFLLPRIARNSIKILTVSEFSRREITDVLGVEPEKVEVVRNAVPSGIKCRRVERKNIVLTVSSLDPRKNLVRLIRAFERIEGYRLVIAGASSNVFRKMGLKGGEGVEFLGHVDDTKLSELYSEASVLVYPSLYEGFGIPPLEAMKCGCPVVVSDIPPHREVCGDAALYVDPHSVESIREGILRVLKDSDLRRELAQRGIRRVREFSWERSAFRVSYLIDSVLYA